MARRVLMADIRRVALGNRGMMVEAAQQCVKESGEPWYICNRMSFTWPFFLCTVLFWTALPYSGGYHREGRDEL